MDLTSDHINILKQFVHLESLSFNEINIIREDLDNLLMSLAQYNNLKILNLESICFPSFIILSTIYSLEELSLSYPCNNNREQYTEKDLVLLCPLKNLKVLILYHSINLSKMIRKQLKEQTLKIPQSTTSCNLTFEQLEEFSYNGDDNENGCEDECDD